MNKIVLFAYYLSFTLIAKSQAVDFTYTTSNGLFCNPSTLQFTPSFTGNPVGFVWTFGNNTGSNSQNASATYSNAGSYTVKLIVIYQRSASSVTKTIVINPSITASIGYDRNYICKPGVINFTAVGGGNTYAWDFGDGSGIVNTNTNNTTHNFAASGSYNIKLLSTAVSGCFDTTSTVIKVQSPPVSGTVSPISGCVPANVTFTAHDTIPLNSSVTNYSWNFDDGSPITSTITNNTNHTYTSPGSYSPSVTISTSEGCTSTYNFIAVGFGTPPSNQLAYPVNPVICGSDTALFFAKATNANSYYYNFNDGSYIYASDTIAKHKFRTLGTKYVYILPLYNGCYSQAITVHMDVVGVIAGFNYSNNCTDKKTFSFTNTSQGNLSTVSWDFGDGSPLVNTLNPTHTFPALGSFVTTLKVTDNVTGCTDSYSQIIYTSTPSLINPDSSICRNSITTFSVINNINNPLDSFTWHVTGQVAGPFADSTFTTTASAHGNFNDYVVINNGTQYCQDTIHLNHPLLVRGPDLSFTAPPSLCLGSVYTVTNNSKPFVPTDFVTQWNWDFGVSNGQDTSYQPQPYVYNNPGTYNVKLTATDIRGCTDTLTDSITVNPIPFLYVVPSTDTLCSGSSDTLFAFHSDNIKWSPSNSLTCATCDTVLTKASANTKYYVTATSQFGCTMTDSVTVNVYPPFTAVPLVKDVYVCLNDDVQLNVDPPGKKIVWSPSSGLSNTNIYGPIARPTQNTTYTATLTDSVGCFTSSASVNVHIKSLPTVDAGPDQNVPDNSSFSINPVYSSNVSTYNWTPGNLLSCSTCPDPTGIATSDNTFYINVTSDSGCVAKDSIIISIECKASNLFVPTAFTPNNDNLNDYLYPLTRGIKSIARFSIYDRFGKLVFEAKNFPPNDKTYGWNGKVKDADESTSVFVYYLEALCDSGERLYKKGSVVLIR